MKNFSRKLLALLLAVCLCACLLPAASAADAPTVSPIAVSFLYRNNLNGTCDVLYSTELTICRDMIDIILVNKEDTELLDLLRFSCTMSDALIAQLPDVDSIHGFVFSNLMFAGQPLFEQVGTARQARGKVQFTYKLRDPASFATANTAELKAALGCSMNMRAGYNGLSLDYFSEINKLKTVATIDVRSEDGFDVPGYNSLSVRAAYGASVTDLTVPLRPLTLTSQTGVDEMLNTTEYNAFLQGYPDGTFRPQNTITRAEAAVALYRQLLPSAKAPATKGAALFSDVDPDCWYGEAVAKLSEIGIIKGIGGGKYAPDRPITRADFAVILSRFAKPAELSDADVPFSDVPATHYAYDSIMTAAHYGWVNGVGGGKFAPAKNITRAEAAKMLCLFTGRTCDEFAVDCGYARSFPDVTDANWAYYYIAEVTTPHECVMLGSFKCWDLSK